MSADMAAAAAPLADSHAAALLWVCEALASAGVVDLRAACGPVPASGLVVVAAEPALLALTALSLGDTLTLHLHDRAVGAWRATLSALPRVAVPPTAVAALHARVARFAAAHVLAPLQRWARPAPSWRGLPDGVRARIATWLTRSDRAAVAATHRGAAPP
jgi:hypothetical protein